jgi:CheY-like chemotaxis protein
MGVQVDRATSGEEALAAVDAASQPHDWYLVDWKMPGMDGIACAREILQRQPMPRPSIVLVTGFARDDALRASAALPLAGLLHKPVTPSTLHDVLVQARRPEPPPAVTPRRMLDSPTLSPEVRGRLVGARVLLAEDHPLNQELACELLRRAGIEVVVAKDGREALARLDAEGPFDAVLMDCQMPEMDGYTATRALRADPRWQSLPVIAMTASALVEDRDRALASGMNAHITKPIYVDAMLRTMAEWIDIPRARSSAVATPPAVDRAVGLGHCMGNEAIYRRLLDGFGRSEASFVTELRAAMQAGRWDDARRRAHDLKGLAATIGAPALNAAALSLETALEARDSEAVAAPLAHVDMELQRVLDAIAALNAQ